MTKLCCKGWLFLDCIETRYHGNQHTSQASVVIRAEFECKQNIDKVLLSFLQNSKELSEKFIIFDSLIMNMEISMRKQFFWRNQSNFVLFITFRNRLNESFPYKSALILQSRQLYFQQMA